MEGVHRAWDFLGRADKSFVVTTFRGLTASTLTCRTCGWRSVKYDHMMELVLQLPDDNSRYSVDKGVRKEHLALVSYVNTCIMQYETFAFMNIPAIV